jgi:hypothetical protein
VRQLTTEEIDTDSTALAAPPGSTSRVRRKDGIELEGLELVALIEMIATGELGGDDQVALMGNPFEEIRNIEDLARHLLPSTTATTNRVFEPGVPDYQVLLKDTSMLKVLARMRQGAETGALFVHKRDGNNHPIRKEIYLRSGRLFHVASSEREELLGEYLVRRGRISREELQIALAALHNYGGHLGDTLIGLNLVDAMDIFRAIRDQGRDRVASLCGWTDWVVTFYRGTAAAWVQFPLDLDLASPMMAGTLVASSGDPKKLLPRLSSKLTPGPRAASCSLRKERGSAPLSLQWLPKLADDQPTLEEVIAHMTRDPDRKDRRQIGEREACAALITAQLTESRSHIAAVGVLSRVPSLRRTARTKSQQRAEGFGAPPFCPLWTPHSMVCSPHEAPLCRDRNHSSNVRCRVPARSRSPWRKNRSTRVYGLGANGRIVFRSRSLKRSCSPTK